VYILHSDFRLALLIFCGWLEVLQESDLLRLAIEETESILRSNGFWIWELVGP
jgi:hypothetical protein